MTAGIPYGYCHCGCGQRTNPAPKTSARNGWIEGEPLKFVLYHRGRKPLDPPNPSGLCMCGCGETTSISKQNNYKHGYVKGEHVRYRPGHMNIKTEFPGYVEEDRGFETPCWIWQGGLNSKGYGVHRHKPAHRVVYEREREPVPDALDLDHLCRVPPCVNPDHLEPVTHRENCRRGVATKLTVEQVAEIKADTESSLDELAERYPVCAEHIRGIQKGKFWKDVVPA